MSKLTVGRLVLFYNTALAAGDSPQSGSVGPGYNGQGAGPYPAIVTQVFTDQDGDVTYANLKVLPPFAPPYDEGSVSEAPASVGFEGRVWMWPEGATGDLVPRLLALEGQVQALAARAAAQVTSG